MGGVESRRKIGEVKPLYGLPTECKARYVARKQFLVVVWRGIGIAR